MVEVRFKGPLSQFFGASVSVQDCGEVSELLAKLDKGGTLTKEGKIRPGLLVLINGKDWRLHLGPVGLTDIVEVIPVNHGG
ncbi:hypothetical protein HS1genome_0004 [Sulfodiicoccus acidiphilus]|uniref:Ubiquitin n=1 Tax=Sulfodiicoccus acidiphilus TaxID=1670455 RepID=A0A348B0B3_9CREN|nr:ubiquitin [Sulfodiicoccus acidiphilus]BBD71615.1 hypothetical protein HS1genome_0004 [Sulfodiicoccus acidiphilus]GGT87074.1 hypothetical protein GCM10007116_01390 [Sulfodiicoccus acidiphilus]